MSILLQAEFRIASGFGGQEFATAAPIVGDYSADAGIAKLAQNAMWLEAYANRRTLATFGCIGHFSDGLVGEIPYTTTDASDPPTVILFEASVNLSADTDRIGFVARGTNTRVQIEIFGTDAKTGSIDTMDSTNATAVEANLSDTSITLGGDVSVTLEIRFNKMGAAATGELFGLYVYELPLLTADLP